MGHSIDWYALLPDDANSEIMRSVYGRFTRVELHVPLELTGLRLIYFLFEDVLL